MKSLLQITLLLISSIVAVTSAGLILDYNWPEPKKSVQRYPHPASCSHFFVNKPDGSQSLKKCPENELFDFHKLRCQEKISAKCWNDFLKKDHSKKTKRLFSCPFPWGLYPDVEDCSMFYDCLSGRPYLRKCPYSTLFDKAERTCVDENEAMCADHSDIAEGDYKCPYKWGYFTYIKDCSKYYECLRKVPSLRSCKKNMLFDNSKRKCMPLNIVDCGERFNPYEKEKVTIEHILTGGDEMTTKFTPTDEERATPQRFSTRGDEMTTKFIPTEERASTERFSTGGDEKTTKFIPTEERATTERFSTGGDEMTTKFIPTEERATTERFSTGGDEKTTKFIPTEERATTERFSTGGDEMTTKHIPA